MTRIWPEGFPRIPDQEWTRASVDELALGYDNVEEHGWYDNLDPTVEDIRDVLEPGDIVLDYSGGTGILVGRLLDAIPQALFGVIDVDASKKFLRLALEKFGKERRVAFRWIRYLKDENRVQTVQEVFEEAMLERGVDILASTNAIHLYYGLEETLASWREIIRPGGHVFVQSGNIGLPTERMPEGAWIIDETVTAIDQAARELVYEETRWAPYRDGLDDVDRMRAYRELREKFFLPIRPLSHYTDALEGSGFIIENITHRTVDAKVEEWYEFLSVYHEGVLGWVGGSERIEGEAPSDAAVEDRLDLLRSAMDRVFEGEDAFEAAWTYLSCRPA